jgi:hypothetical protein
MVNNGNATQHGSKIIIDSPATLSAILAWRRPLSVEKDKAGIAAGLVLFWSQILAGIDAGLLFLRLRKG